MSRTFNSLLIYVIEASFTVANLSELATYLVKLVSNKIIKTKAFDLIPY